MNQKLNCKLLFAVLATISLGLPGISAPDESAPPITVYPGSEPVDKPTSQEASADGFPADEQPVSQSDAKIEAAGEPSQSGASTISAAQHYELGAHYFAKWELDLAQVELDEAVYAMPTLKIAHRDLCLIALAKLDVARSLAEFMMVTGIAEAIPYNKDEKAQLDQRAMQLHYKKGLKWGTANNWQEAITELLWAHTYAPKNPAIIHSLAFAYASSGDFQKAEDYYKATFNANPTDGTAHADFANLLMDKGQLAKAEEEMRTAVKLTPNAAALHVDLGWIAEGRNDYATATQQFKEAVKLSPKHAGLWAHLGKLMERQNDLLGAREAYRQALELDSRCEEARVSLDRLNQSKT